MDGDVILIFIFLGLKMLFFLLFLDFEVLEWIELDLSWLLEAVCPCVFLVFLEKQKNSYSV